MKRNNINQLAVFLGLAVSIFLLSTTNAFADEKQGFNKEEHRKEWQKKRSQMFEKLDLSEEQKQALKAHRESHRDGMKVLRGQIKEKRKMLRQALENPDADDNAITEVNNKIKVLTNKMADDRLNGILEVRKILTPEQFTKFNEIKKEHKGKRHGNRKGSQSQ